MLRGINGTVGKYRLQVSEDGTEWIDAGSGEFTREDYNLHEIDAFIISADLVYGSFDQRNTARYVRLISDSGALERGKDLQRRGIPAVRGSLCRTDDATDDDQLF